MESFTEYISLGRGGGTSYLAAMLDVFKKIFAVRHDDGVQVVGVRTEERRYVYTGPSTELPLSGVKELALPNLSTG